MLRLRPGDQNIGRDQEVAPIELLRFRDVLRGDAAEPLVQIAAVVDPAELGEFFLGMREQVDAFAPQRVRQQDLGRQPRNGDICLPRGV